MSISPSSEPSAPMTRPRVNAITAFVPSRDFARSKAFYLDLGFEQTWSDASACGLQMDGHHIILQNFYVKDLAENFMMQLVVDDVAAWWERIQSLGLKEKFQLGTAKAPAMQPWGLVVLYLSDPAGVLWHIAEAPKPEARA
jgi:Glyoxalase/Bleomycin resistance protein/Dioxygenase superfamily